MNDESPQTLGDQLRFAIAHKRLIEVAYSGRTRVAEPHDYGIKTGGEKLLVYQLREAAPQRGKPATGWRLLDAAKIENCKVLEQTFRGSRGRSTQRHMDWDEVFARVT